MTEPVSLTSIPPVQDIPGYPNGAPVPPRPVSLGVTVDKLGPEGLVTDLAAFRAQAIEGMGSAGIGFQPDGPDTEIFMVSHPLLLDDYKHEKLAETLSTPEIAKVLLNTIDDPDVYARFVAAGGRSGDVLIAWRRLGQGLGAPKSAKP